MMNAKTGRLLSLRDHIRQSVADILFTRIGSRIQREQYGSIIPELIDSPITGDVLPMMMASGVFMALATYEPRIIVTNVAVNLADIATAGVVVIIDYQLNGSNITEQIQSKP